MTGGKKLAGGISALVIFMFGVYATTSMFVGNALHGGAPSDVYGTFIVFFIIALIIPTTLYITSPKACPICKMPV